jgi:hypothetical protein
VLSFQAAPRNVNLKALLQNLEASPNTLVVVKRDEFETKVVVTQDTQPIQTEVPSVEEDPGDCPCGHCKKGSNNVY